MINVLWQQTLDELRGVTKHYVARPQSVNAATAVVLPIQLSTRALPAMELEERDLLGDEAGLVESLPALMVRCRWGGVRHIL